jgi:hypothetical protein
VEVRQTSQIERHRHRQNGNLIGAGAGQMNRVTSVKLALDQAGENARGAVLASDAFFLSTISAAPLNAGVSAFIQLAARTATRDSTLFGDEFEPQWCLRECAFQTLSAHKIRRKRCETQPRRCRPSPTINRRFPVAG